MRVRSCLLDMQLIYIYTASARALEIRSCRDSSDHDRESASALRPELVEQHDFGLLIVRDVRVAVDSQIGPCPGRVVGERLALCGH